MPQYSLLSFHFNPLSCRLSFKVNRSHKLNHMPVIRVPEGTTVVQCCGTLQHTVQQNIIQLNNSRYSP